jgi:hypothetical protein
LDGTQIYPVWGEKNSYTTVTDTGFSTDHDMIVHWLHLEIEHVTIKDEVKERMTSMQ